MATMASFIPTTTITMNNSNNQNHHQHHHHLSCADMFLDLSSTCQGAHHRSISDSVAFLNQPLVEENKVVNATMTQPNMFDSLDDEQLKSMFSNDFTFPVEVPTTVSSSNPSTPLMSDQNSHNYEKPAPGEVESSCKLLETHASEAPSRSNGGDSITDPKRVKRILANRQSAQRSRVRKLQYISELERSVTTLQTEVSALSPRVAFSDHQRLVLTVENSTLKQRIAALAQDKIFKDAHQESLRKEIERLKQVYLHQQSLQQINNHYPQPQQQQLLPPLPPRNEGQQLIS